VIGHRQEFMENESEALPGVAYPGVRDNRSTLNTKTGYDDDDDLENTHFRLNFKCRMFRCRIWYKIGIHSSPADTSKSVCIHSEFANTAVFSKPGFSGLESSKPGFGFANGQRTGTVSLLTAIKPVTLPDHRLFSGLFIVSKLLFMRICVVCCMY